MNEGKKLCPKCKKLLDEKTKFYTYKNGQKTELCKSCLTMHINNFEPDTFLWLLEEMDVPYIEEEWISLRDKAIAKSPNLNGMSVFGKYLSKMKLKQFKEYSWADTERIQQERDEKRKASEQEKEEYEQSLKEQFAAGEINEAQYKTLMSTETQYKEAHPAPPMEFGNPYMERNFMPEEDMPDLGADLTKDDKLYLSTKWGRLYTPTEWVQLEQKYNEMMRSFDIHDADTVNTLKFICKADLKMNQAIDQGDIESFQKLSKVSNDLRKSSNFTAAQNKSAKDDAVDSIGALVAYCEKNGGSIPKFEIETPIDIVDKVINDLKDYTKSLIYEDKALSKQIEDYLKKREIAAQQKKDLEDAKAQGLDAVELDDEDYTNYYEDIEEQIQQDINTLQIPVEEEDEE